MASAEKLALGGISNLASRTRPQSCLPYFALSRISSLDVSMKWNPGTEQARRSSLHSFPPPSSFAISSSNFVEHVHCNAQSLANRPTYLRVTEVEAVAQASSFKLHRPRSCSGWLSFTLLLVHLLRLATSGEALYSKFTKPRRNLAENTVQPQKPGNGTALSAEAAIPSGQVSSTRLRDFARGQERKIGCKATPSSQRRLAVNATRTPPYLTVAADVEGEKKVVAEAAEMTLRPPLSRSVGQSLRLIVKQTFH